MKLAISVGELSGDEHGAALVQAMRALRPKLQIRGMGGRHMRAAGVELIVDSEKTGSVMGFQELLPKAKKIFETMSTMKRLLRDWRPTALVIIDYPDFNLRLARYAKSLGIKVFYFITPKVWAWRSGRTKTINELVDLAAVIFPFEREFFEDHGFSRVVYVGHPFSSTLKRLSQEEEEKFRGEMLISFGVDPSRPVLAIFPGSRRHEVLSHMKPILGALKILHRRHPQVQFIVSIASSVENAVREKLVSADIPITAICNRSIDILRIADAGLLKSGTSNLQAAYFGIPFSMFFKASIITEFIVRSFVGSSCYSIVNFIRRNSVAELIQAHVEPRYLALEAEQLLFDKTRRSHITSALGEVVNALSSADSHPLFKDGMNAYERAASLLLSL